VSIVDGLFSGGSHRGANVVIHHNIFFCRNPKVIDSLRARSKDVADLIFDETKIDANIPMECISRVSKTLTNVHFTKVLRNDAFLAVELQKLLQMRVLDIIAYRCKI